MVSSKKLGPRVAPFCVFLGVIPAPFFDILGRAAGRKVEFYCSVGYLTLLIALAVVVVWWDRRKA